MVCWINIQLLLRICAVVSFHHPRVTLKKLIVAQLVKKFPTLCRTWGFITLFTKTQYWFLSRVKSVQSLMRIYFKICSNIILLPTSSSYYWSLPFSFSGQNSVRIAFVAKRKVLLSWFPSFINVTFHKWYLIWGYLYKNCYLAV
jgi:hypothetical protein